MEVEDETTSPSRTYKLDFDTWRINGFVDDEEALQQAAAKALYTPRFDCYAYDDQYGHEIARLLRNRNQTQEYIEAEIEFIIRDTLLQDGRFLDIEDLEIEFDRDEVTFSFTLDTILGQTQMEGASEYV